MLHSVSRVRGKAERARLWRLALLGAAIFGAVGFFSGIALCLVYRLPIPPIFTTELGIFVGGCAGAAVGFWTAPSPAPSAQDPGGWYETTDVF